jgi:transcriptional activator of cad operon
MLITNNNIRLSNLTLDPATQTLSLDRSFFVQLKPQSFELLCYFCANQHKIVSREELITHVWRSRIVSDNAINRAISQLRLAIAQLDPEQEYIQTMPRAGYRLCVKPTSSKAEPTSPVSDQAYAHAERRTDKHLDDPDEQELESVTLTPEIGVPLENLQSNIQSQKPSPTVRNALVVSCMLLLLLMLFSWTRLTNTDAKNQLLSSEAQSYAPGADYDASITRDWMVFVNRNDHEFNVIASNRHNGEMRTVHQSADTIRFPRLSPNIDLMSVFLRKNERLGLKACQLDIIRFHSSKLVKSFPCGLANVVTQRWLSSSKVQVVTATEGQGLKVMAFDLNNEQQQPELSIAFPDERLRFISVQFSPDGTEIALLSRNMASNQTHLSIFSLSSQEVKPGIILPGVAVSAVQWLENGDYVWLESGKLFKTNADGLNSVELLTDLSAITQLNAVYDGALFVSHGQTRMNLISVGQDSKEVSQVVSSKDEFMPVFSHHSDQFVFFSNRTGRLELWLGNGQNAARKLILPEQELLLKPVSWSPDDSHLAIASKLSVLVYSLADARVQEIAIPQSHQAVWVNNSRLAILKDSHADELITYDLFTGEKSRISLPFSASNVQFHDEVLYLSKNDSNDIWQYDLETGKLHPLSVIANTAQGLWQVKNGTLYYVPVSQEKMHIEKRELATGNQQILYNFNIADAPLFSVSSSESILLQRQVHDETDVSAIHLR